MVAARVGGRTADGQRRPAVVIRLAGAKSSATSSLGTLRSFSEADFQVRLTQVYGRVREAWTAQRLADLEPDVTIDLLAEWTARLAAAPVPVMVPVQRVTATIVEAGSHRDYERLTVSLDAGEVRSGPALQLWTFERGSPGTTRGHTCSSCGAALVLDQRGHCASCGATVDIGRLTWVLARVEGPLDWSERQFALDQGTLEVLDAIEAADPAFDPEVFADRVMALYPHLLQAIQDPSCPLARVAIAPRLRRGHETMRAVRDRLGRRAVIDSIRVTGVMISSADHTDSGDSITVDIVGISARYEIDAAEQVVKGESIPQRIADRWIFTRPAGVTTSAHGGVLIERCTACGAPIELDNEGRCAHCGAKVTLGTGDWVLSGTSTYEDVPPASDRTR